MINIHNMMGKVSNQVLKVFAIGQSCVRIIRCLVRTVQLQLHDMR